MKRLLLVRHGESEWNAARRLQGQADIGLSPRGELQALALAPVVASYAPGLVLTSDLKRASRTAALLGYPDATLEPGLREMSVGAWTGLEISAITATEPTNYLGWRAGTYAPDNGEHWSEFRDRIAAVLALAVAAPADNVLLVCHGGVIRAALDVALSLAPARIIPVGPASLTILAYRGAEARLEAFNVSSTAPILDAPD